MGKLCGVSERARREKARERESQRKSEYTHIESNEIPISSQHVSEFNAEKPKITKVHYYIQETHRQHTIVWKCDSHRCNVYAICVHYVENIELR